MGAPLRPVLLPEYEEYPTIGEEAEEVNAVLRDSYITGIRKGLFKAINKRRGGPMDWAFITGKKSREKDGRRITLSKYALRELQKVVDYLNTEEVEGDLREMALTSPDHIDGMIDLIQGAKTDRVMKAEEFRLFQKHKEKILRYLARVL